MLLQEEAGAETGRYRATTPTAALLTFMGQFANLVLVLQHGGEEGASEAGLTASQ